MVYHAWRTLSLRRLACHVLVESEVIVLVELLQDVQGLVGVQLKPVRVPSQLQVPFAKASKSGS